MYRKKFKKLINIDKNRFILLAHVSLSSSIVEMFVHKIGKGREQQDERYHQHWPDHRHPLPVRRGNLWN